MNFHLWFRALNAFSDHHAGLLRLFAYLDPECRQIIAREEFHQKALQNLSRNVTVAVELTGPPWASCIV